MKRAWRHRAGGGPPGRALGHDGRAGLAAFLDEMDVGITALVIDEGAVRAAEVRQRKDALTIIDDGMLARDMLVLDANVVVFVPANRRRSAFQQNVLMCFGGLRVGR